MVLSLQSSGILPLCMIALKILVSWRTPQSPRCLSTSIGIPSGAAALTILHFFQLSFYVFTCDLMQRTFGQWFVSAVNMLYCLVEQVPVILSPSTDIFFCAHEQGSVLCFHKVTLVVIFGWLVSRFCQPIDSLFTFSSVQFLIQFLCCSCSFNCHGSLWLSLCLFVSSMIFFCFRLLPLLEHPLFPGYCILDCYIPPPGLPFLYGRSTSIDPAVLAALLFNCFRKYCPFRLFTMFHVVDDILGIVISYCSILKSPPFDLDFVLSPILSL